MRPPHETASRLAGMWERTLLIWTTDNGSPIQVAGSNHPLRGGKSTNFEGGVRVPAFVYSPLLPTSAMGTSVDALFHVTDLHATMLAVVAGTFVYVGATEVTPEEWEDSVVSEADSQEEMQMTFSRISLVDVIHLRTSSMTTS